ncbi:hypothetical protein D3C84_1146900 [compost metagenome]
MQPEAAVIPGLTFPNLSQRTEKRRAERHKYKRPPVKNHTKKQVTRQALSFGKIQQCNEREQNKKQRGRPDQLYRKAASVF